MPSLTLVIILFATTQSGISTKAITKLQEQVTTLYASAGVRVNWAPATTAGSIIVNLVRRMPPIKGCESALGCSVIDRASSTPPVAYVDSDHIRREELRDPLLRGHLLGRVVAHEIGHLVGLRHSNDFGIMHRDTHWRSPRLFWTDSERKAIARLAIDPPYQSAADKHYVAD